MMKTLNDLIGRVLLPSLETVLKAKFDEFSPKVLALMGTKFDEWLPKIVQAVVLAVARSAGQLVVNTEDRVTDIIPGTLDDKILDPIVNDVMKQLPDLFGNLFSPRP